MKNLINVAINDFKLIFRDPSLRIFLALPILIYIVINFFLPYLVREYPAVNNYIPYVVIVATMEISQMFGFIYSFVLIEEKETEVAKIYGIVPISKFWFIIFRLFVPFLITTLLTWVMLIIQPFYNLFLLDSFAFALLTGLTSPLLSLGVSILSKNKMEGMVWIKVLNLSMIIPIVAFFVPTNFVNFFGIFPVHWAFQGLFNLINHEPYLLWMNIGFVYFIFILIFLVKIFSKRHYV